MLGGLLAACTPQGKPPAQREQDQDLPKALESALTDLDAQALPAPGDERKAAPMSLTASDGTGLELVSLTARAVVQEPLAFTQLHLVFDNPQARTIEGNFQIDLPPGAAISRFAMKIDSRWQEGEVVERQAARRAYEDFLHRKQDPALLEKQAGNRFSARVFPIPANGRKELIISYSQELPDSGEPYRLELEGLPKLEELDVKIVIDRPSGSGAASLGGAATSLGGASSSREQIVVHKTDFVPDKNLEVASKRPAQAVGIRHQELVLARITAVGDLPPDPIDELTILFDTSASRALGFAGQLHRLNTLVGQLRATKDFRLRVMTFDQDLAQVYDGPASGFGSGHIQTIYSARAMGASNLTHAITRLAEVGGTKRVLLISDGIATAGDTELGSLQAAVSALGEAGVERLDAVIDGGLQDRDVLAAMTTAGLARDGVVLDARTPASTLASRLALATASDIAVTVPGAEWSWPTTLDGVQPGDEVLVYAKLPAHMGMRVILDGAKATEAPVQLPVQLTRVSKPLLERAWVGARINATTLQRSALGTEPTDQLLRDELQREIVRLSTTHRVLSDFTALLVLETEQDYARFDIDRKALADILTVSDAGVVATHRDELWFGAAANNPNTTGPDTLALADLEETPPPEEDDNEDAGGEGQRHRGEEGHMGRPSNRSQSDLYAMQGGAFAVGDDDEDVWGGLTGDKIGEAYGAGGLGLVGTGRGGGGTGEGTIGQGNTGLIGEGGGGGTGSGYGRGSGAGFGGRGMRVPRVRQAKPEVQGSLDRDIIRRIVRAHLNEVRSCYNAGLTRNPNLQGRVAINFVISASGSVGSSVVQESTLRDASVATCIARAVKRWSFPRPSSGNVIVTYPFNLDPGGGDAPVDAGPPPPPPTPAELEQRRLAAELAERERLRQQAVYEAEQAEARRSQDSPYSGKLFDVMTLIADGQHDAALTAALAWRDESPGDVLALLAVGEALEALGKPRAAARAYGSLIDLFPARADLRRYAGARLERLGDEGMRLAADTYAQAVAQRGDHPASHRLYAYALLRQGQLEPAFEAILAGATRDYPSGRFEGVERILDEDLGLIASAWIKAEPLRRAEIEARVRAAGGVLPSGPTLRFVMTWETDANDVDFHIHDGKGGHAYYSDPSLPSGGKLYADVTTGYGPECFTIQGKPAAFPYRFEANYYSRGPMGYGMGKLQIMQSDGQGDLRFEDRVYVIMKDSAFVQLGTLDKPL